MKTTIGILSFNNPNYTDRLVENINKLIKINYQLIVFDNGSDKDKISKYTTHRCDDNVRMTGGFNNIIKSANEFDYIWFFTNDCYFVTEDVDPLENMLEKFIKYNDIGILHPSLDQKVNVCYDIKNTKSSGVKIVSEYDFVCPMFSKKALEYCGGNFNNNLICGWGIDYETSFLVRSNNLKVAINHDLIVMHNTSATYDQGLDCTYSDRNKFYDAAFKEMYSVLDQKYGVGWSYKFKSMYREKVGEWYE
jgi:glycosyltransferase involved in cell wall biosynthesis